ncbi:hypothetical protein SDJN03_24274, partial [Cucurbita argyrosperma subsp. sororia]
MHSTCMIKGRNQIQLQGMGCVNPTKCPFFGCIYISHSGIGFYVLVSHELPHPTSPLPPPSGALGNCCKVMKAVSSGVGDRDNGDVDLFLLSIILKAIRKGS